MGQDGGTVEGRTAPYWPAIIVPTTAVASAALGVAVLVGWALDIPVLKSISPAFVSMKSNAALGFLATGLALWLLYPQTVRVGRRRLGRIAATIPTLIGLLTLAEYATGWDIGIDQLLFTEPAGAVGTIHLGRAAPNAALSFVLVGGALLLMEVRLARWGRPADYLAVLVMLVALPSFAGYLYATTGPVDLPGFARMPLNACLGFLALAFGLLLVRGECGIGLLLTSRGLGGVLARRLIVPSAVLLFGLNWLNAAGERAGLYSRELGTALTVTTVSVVLASLVYVVARFTDRAEGELRRARDELEQRKRQHTAELEYANQELRRRNAELDEFTYVASHDLQDPLRKLTAFSSLLPRDSGHDLPEKARTDLEFIADAAQRMQSLIQDLLTLSRTGKSTMKHERVSLSACVDHALEALAAHVEETGAEISRDELPDAVGDASMLAQLYQNLIGNALKFSARVRRPMVHLTAEQDDGQWILGVQDNGIGIEPEYTEQIFAPFKRLHGRDEYAGTGIGLAICRKAVDRHGGRIWVESEPDRGAHFKFTLSDVMEAKPCQCAMESQPSFC
jgi:signal transduction histidine kinase